MKYLGNEEGFTLMEVLLAALMLAVLSLPIFYNSLQSANNYVSAEKYYKATLDAENIITQVKASLDYKIDNLSGGNKDIESTFNSSVIASKALDVPADLNTTDGKSLFTDAEVTGLGLERYKYSYEVYLKKIDTTINIPARNVGNGVYKFKYGLNLTTQPIPIVVDVSTLGSTSPVPFSRAITAVDADICGIVVGNPITIGTGTNNKLNSSIVVIDHVSTLKLEYIVKDTPTVNPINISTYNMTVSGAPPTDVNIVVRNYTNSNIDVNLFTDLKHDSKKDVLVSYDMATKGSIHVVTNPNTLPVPEYNYVIVVAVTDNTKGNKILVQLTDVYSYVPK
jgi:hypothetical protein